MSISALSSWIRGRVDDYPRIVKEAKVQGTLTNTVLLSLELRGLVQL